MVEWTVDREIFSVGFITLRYYSLFFMVSFLLGVAILKRVFKMENYPAIDVDDLVLVETDDAILICKRDSSQKVKDVVDKIRHKELNNYL